MTETIRKPLGIRASGLRVIALVCMLLYHLWAAIGPGDLWLTCVGRLAFPIFAFQLVEGYLHTASRKRYAMRLLLLALVSEIPFDLLLSNSAFYPLHQNPIFTLLLGLWAISALDRAKHSQGLGSTFRGLLVLTLASLLAAVGFADHGEKGVLTVVIFYLFRSFPGARLLQLVSMVLLHVVFARGQTIPLLGFHFPIQGFAVLSLLPIWLYDGRKGFGGKWFQWGCYLFYPLHMLALYLLYVH